MGCTSFRSRADEVTWQAISQPDRRDATKQNNEYQKKLEFLSKVPVLRRMPREQFPIFATRCSASVFAKGTAVVKQGDIGDDFFVIRSGMASVYVTDERGVSERLAGLRVGDYFGEYALLRDDVRMATVVADTELSAYSIRRDEFQKLGLSEWIQFANREAVGCAQVRETKAKPPRPKSPAEEELIRTALKQNQNFKTMAMVTEGSIADFIAVMWKESVSRGADLIQEGDLNADYFYVVQDGSFDVFAPQSEESIEDREVVTTIGKGGWFGDVALLYFMPRSATVRATVDSTVWVVDRSNFKRILLQASATTRKRYEQYLRDVPILQSLLSEEIASIAKGLTEMYFVQGETIIEEGERGNTFYIMYEGEVEIIVDLIVVNTLKAQRGCAHFFGEKALLGNERRGATVKVVSSTAKTLILDREAFDWLLGPLKDLIAATKHDDIRQRPSVGPGTEAITRARSLKPSGNLKLKDLKRIGVLGCGGFGNVELVLHQPTGETYALKSVNKGYVVRAGIENSVMNEKNILLMTRHRGIVKLYETFNSPQTLGFLLEVALGGELYATYNRKGLHGNENHAKYYCAAVVLAFEHLHERRIIYRDLKPENLLLNHLGQPKVTDMGLAKFVIGKTYTTCGTPDYFAPELIETAGHTNALDWWTLGIFVFELMSGHPPFEAPTALQIYARVTRGINKVSMPVRFCCALVRFIKDLLRPEPEQRLPMRAGGIPNVMKHSWFVDFDWTAIRTFSFDPPYKPVVKSNTDTGNFNCTILDNSKHCEYRDPGTGWDKEFATSTPQLT